MRRLGAFGLAIALAACNAISGIGDFTYDAAPDASAGCDQSGTACGLFTGLTGCRGCAAMGPCAAEFDACVMTNECKAIMTCLPTCGGTPSCEASCKSTHATGVTDYEPLRICVACNCHASCGESCM